MSRTSKKADDPISRIRKCQKLTANKKCADCAEKLPQYANLTFNTFVCTSCSGIHREFNHRVKSISLSNFTDDEASALKKGGNEACNSAYLSGWTERDQAPPRPGDQSAVRDWIRYKYIDKRWYRDSKSSSRKDGERRQRKSSASDSKKGLDESKGSSRSERRGPKRQGSSKLKKPSSSSEIMKVPAAPPAPSAPAPVPPAPPAQQPPPKPSAADDLLGLVFDAPNPPPQPSTPAAPFDAFSQPPATNPPPQPHQQHNHPSFAGAAAAVMAVNAFQGGNPFDDPPPQQKAPQPQFPPQQPPQQQFPVQQQQQNSQQFPQQPQQQQLYQGGNFQQQPNQVQNPQMPGGYQQQAPQQGFYQQQQHPQGQAPQMNQPQAQHMPHQPQHLSFAGAVTGVMAANAFAGAGQQPPQQQQQQPSQDVSQQMGALNLNQGQPQQQQQQQQHQQFAEGENVFYRDSSGAMIPARINRIHYECTPPYFSVLIYQTGRERNTDANHLVKAQAGPQGLQPAQQEQPQQKAPDPFSCLGYFAIEHSKTNPPPKPQADTVSEDLGLGLGLPDFAQDASSGLVGGPPIEPQSTGDPFDMMPTSGPPDNPFSSTLDAAPPSQPPPEPPSTEAPAAVGNPFDMF